MASLSETLGIPTYDTETTDTAATVDAPLEDVEQVDDDGELELEVQLGQEDEPEYSFLDVDTLGDQMVELKVDGETKIVSASEAIKEYAQKGVFFTQEMQKVRDQERENLDAIQLAKALKANPEGTLRALQATLGVATTEPSVKEDDTYLTDDERKIAALEKQINDLASTQSLSEQRRQLEHDLDSLETKFGSFDREALLAHATNFGIIGNLEAAFAHMNVDKITAGSDAMKREAERRSALEQKRAATAVSRTKQTATGTQSEIVEKPSSVTDSYLLAKEGKSVDWVPDFVKRF